MTKKYNDLQDCEIQWKNDEEINILVYNEDFVNSNFHYSDKFRGIFTLGKKSKEAEEQIKQLMSEKTEKENHKTSLKNTLKKKLKNKNIICVHLRKSASYVI